MRCIVEKIIHVDVTENDFRPGIARVLLDEMENGGATFLVNGLDEHNNFDKWLRLTDWEDSEATEYFPNFEYYSVYKEDIKKELEIRIDIIQKGELK